MTMNQDFDKTEYSKAMDSLQFSMADKQRITARLCQGREQPEEKPKGKGKIVRITAIAVAAALALSVGALATDVGKTASQAFAGLFGTEAAQTEIIDRIGYPIGASVSDNGVTITAEAVMGDAYHCAVIYSIVKEDGTSFEVGLSGSYLPLWFEEQSMSMGYVGGGHGSSYFYDADPTDNVIQYVDIMEYDGDITGRTATAKFENLLVWTEDGYQTLAEGTWKLKFDLAFEDASVSLPAGQQVALNEGVTATVDAITLSPVALRVDYTADAQVVWDENSTDGQVSAGDAAQMRLYLEDLTLTVNLKDGTVIDMTGSGGGITPEDGQTRCQKGDVFDQVIDLEQVVSVTIGDVTVPVNEG
jgi:hypothetical protein